MKGYEITAHTRSLVNLSGKKLPVTLSFAMATNLDRLMEWQERIEKQRIGLCEQYAKKGDDGKPIIKDNKYQIEDMEALNRDVEELMAQECNVEISRVKRSVLDVIDTNPRFDTLAMGEVAALQFMLEE